MVFSSEIRRQEGQVYSTLGGFVREFPLILIAAAMYVLFKFYTNARAGIIVNTGVAILLCGPLLACGMALLRERTGEP